MRTSLRLLAAVALVAATITPAAPASAGSIELTCTADFTLNFSPGVTLSATQTVDVVGTANISNCTLPNGSAGPHGSGAIAHGIATAADASCTNLVIESNGHDPNNRIDWADGTHSKFTVDISVTPLVIGDPVTIAAHVYDGPYAGDTISAVPLIATLQGNCVTGVTQLTANLAVLIVTS